MRVNRNKKQKIAMASLNSVKAALRLTYMNELTERSRKLPNISGVCIISKTDGQNDIDVIAADGSLAGTCTTRKIRAVRVTDPDSADEATNDAMGVTHRTVTLDDRVAKKQRYQQKIQSEKLELENSNKVLLQHRQQLEDVRLEILKFRDAIHHTQIDLLRLAREKKIAEDEFKMKYADFIQATSTIEHTRRTCEKTIFELRERVQSEYDMTRSTSEELEGLKRFEQEMIARDIRNSELATQLHNAQMRNQALEDWFRQALDDLGPMKPAPLSLTLSIPSQVPQLQSDSVAVSLCTNTTSDISHIVTSVSTVIVSTDDTGIENTDTAQHATMQCDTIPLDNNVNINSIANIITLPSTPSNLYDTVVSPLSPISEKCDDVAGIPTSSCTAPANPAPDTSGSAAILFPLSLSLLAVPSLSRNNSTSNGINNNTNSAPVAFSPSTSPTLATRMTPLLRATSNLGHLQPPVQHLNSSLPPMDPIALYNGSVVESDMALPSIPVQIFNDATNPASRDGVAVTSTKNDVIVKSDICPVFVDKKFARREVELGAMYPEPTTFAKIIAHISEHSAVAEQLQLQLRVACERCIEVEDLLRMRDLHIENLNQQVQLFSNTLEQKVSELRERDQLYHEEVSRSSVAAFELSRIMDERMQLVGELQSELAKNHELTYDVVPTCQRRAEEAETTLRTLQIDKQLLSDGLLQFQTTYNLLLQHNAALVSGHSELQRQHDLAVSRAHALEMVVAKMQRKLTHTEYRESVSTETERVDIGPEGSIMQSAAELVDAQSQINTLTLAASEIAAAAVRIADIKPLCDGEHSGSDDDESSDHEESVSGFKSKQHKSDRQCGAAELLRRLLHARRREKEAWLQVKRLTASAAVLSRTQRSSIAIADSIHSRSSRARSSIGSGHADNNSSSQSSSSESEVEVVASAAKSRSAVAAKANSVSSIVGHKRPSGSKQTGRFTKLSRRVSPNVSGTIASAASVTSATPASVTSAGRGRVGRPLARSRVVALSALRHTRARTPMRRPAARLSLLAAVARVRPRSSSVGDAAKLTLAMKQEKRLPRSNSALPRPRSASVDSRHQTLPLRKPLSTNLVSSRNQLRKPLKSHKSLVARSRVVPTVTSTTTTNALPFKLTRSFGPVSSSSSSSTSGSESYTSSDSDEEIETSKQQARPQKKPRISEPSASTRTPGPKPKSVTSDLRINTSLASASSSMVTVNTPARRSAHEFYLLDPVEEKQTSTAAPTANVAVDDGLSYPLLSSVFNASAMVLPALSGRVYYGSCMMDTGEDLKPGDFLVVNQNKAQLVIRLVYLYQDPLRGADGDRKMMRGRWYYKQEQLRQTQTQQQQALLHSTGRREVFQVNRESDFPIAEFIRLCEVIFPAASVANPEDRLSSGRDQYYCRRAFDLGSGDVEPMKNTRSAR